MNPENKALERTYFVGGAPRIGKSIFSYALADKIKGHVVTTDAIRSAAKRACLDKNSDLFRINKENDLSEEEWLAKHLNTPELVVEDQNKESVAFWSSVVGFCNNFCEDNVCHIVEGVALLPSLVAGMQNQPKHVFYIGNTSPDHFRYILEYSKNNPEQDWMAAMNYSEDKIKGMVNFIMKMSEYFKAEAAKYRFPYYEIEDNNFDKSIEEIIQKILGPSFN